MLLLTPYLDAFRLRPKLVNQIRLPMRRGGFPVGSLPAHAGRQLFVPFGAMLRLPLTMSDSGRYVDVVTASGSGPALKRSDAITGTRTDRVREPNQDERAPVRTEGPCNPFLTS